MIHLIAKTFYMFLYLKCNKRATKEKIKTTFHAVKFERREAASNEQRVSKLD